MLEGGQTGLLNKGGGSNRLPGLVTKQQAVDFHRYRLVCIIVTINLILYCNFLVGCFNLSNVSLDMKQLHAL